MSETGRINKICHWSLMQTEKSLAEGKRIMLETRFTGGGRVVRRCMVNFQCRGVLLVWITVGQGPIALAVGAGGVCF